MTDTSGNRLEALFTIMDYDLSDSLQKVLNKSKMPVFLLTHGHGSAKSIIYDILGYGSPKKIVSVSVETSKMSNFIMSELHNEINLNKPGTGIAFTISLSSISNAFCNALNQANENLKVGSEDMTTTTVKKSHHLIFTIVDSGYFDQVMEAATAAGATGGTLVHARAIGPKEAERYLGITLQPEKDIVLILATKESRLAIMESITRIVGLNHGVCFSLPVNDTFGVGTGLKIPEDI